MSAVQDIFLESGIELVELNDGMLPDSICDDPEIPFPADPLLNLLVSGKAIAVGPDGMMIVPTRSSYTVIPMRDGTLVIF